jgi:hypothetical protein
MRTPNTINNVKRRIGAALVALTLPLMMLSFATPVANATTVGSTVTAADKCVWYMSTMKNFVIRNANRYNGDALVLTNTDASVPEGSETEFDLKLGLSASKQGSGNALAGVGSGKDCSFYNSQFGQKVIVTPDNGEFVASYVPDGGEPTVVEALGFSLAESPMSFTVGLRDNTFCVDGFTAGGGRLVSSAGTTLLERPLANVEKDYPNAGSQPFCNPSLTLSVTVPAVQAVPAGSGSIFTFTGPTLTFSNSVN